MVTLPSIFSGDWSVDLFQATSNTSLFTVVPTVLVKTIPVKLLITFYVLPCYSKKKKKSLSQNNYYRGFSEVRQVFSFPYIIGKQIKQLLKTFTLAYDFIEFLSITNRIGYIVSYSGLMI